MSYKFCRIENDVIKTYDFTSYDDAKNWIDQELEKFKIMNRVDDELKDRSFIAFKSQLEQILHAKENKGQVMDDYLRCNSCKREDHEGQFCRCESRNIRIAKEIRSRGESPWSKLQPERLSEKTPEGEAIV